MSDPRAWPAFFAEVPICLYDPLAELLGAPADGMLEYGLADAVALAGHACPTVASTYWLTACALRALYRDETPQRGAIRVMLSGVADEGTNGVQASVVSLLTGAAAEGGLGGLQGRHRRAGLLSFGAAILAQFCFMRTDTREAVLASAQLAGLGLDPEARSLLGECLAERADAAGRARFAALWQARLRKPAARLRRRSRGLRDPSALARLAGAVA